MHHYLDLQPSGDNPQKVAYIKNKKRKKVFIYLCHSRETNTRTQRIIIPDEYIEERKDYQQGIFPYFENSKDQNHRIMVTASSGSGKSCWIAQVLKQMAYKLQAVDDDDFERIPIENGIDNQIVIFSAVKHDRALDIVYSGADDSNGKPAPKEPIRVNFNSDNIEALDSNNFANSIVIFDDVEQYSKDVKVKKRILGLRAEMFENARHQNTDLISVSHKAKSGGLNTTVKNESTGLAIFPYHSNQYRELQGFLREYMGYNDPALINYILNEIGATYYETRYVYISKKNPNLLIHRNGVEIIPSTGMITGEARLVTLP